MLVLMPHQNSTHLFIHDFSVFVPSALTSSVYVRARTSPTRLVGGQNNKDTGSEVNTFRTGTESGLPSGQWGKRTDVEGADRVSNSGWTRTSAVLQGSKRTGDELDTKSCGHYRLQAGRVEVAELGSCSQRT